MSDAGWYPVALAAGIEPGTSAGTRLFGQELVIWRDAAGNSHVWEDRCPHRGMRLSFGFVRGDHIACLYHGWRFDAAGQCRFIPAHPGLDVPSTIKAKEFPTAERIGIVWVYWGAADAAGPVPGRNAAMTPVRSLSVAVPEAAILAALANLPSPWRSGAPSLIEQNGPVIWLRAGGEGLAMAVQPLSADEVCLHLAIAGTAEGDRKPERSRISRWAEALRRRAEAGSDTTARGR